MTASPAPPTVAPRARDRHRHVRGRPQHGGPRAWRTSAGSSSTTCRPALLAHDGRAGRAHPGRASPASRSSSTCAAGSFFADLHGDAAPGSTARGVDPRVLFLEASRRRAGPPVRERRGARTRCRATAGSLDGIARERELLRRAARATPTSSSTPRDLNVHELRAQDRGGVRRRRRARAAGHRALLRLQVRPAGRRRHGRRRALPAQPALGPRAAAADRARRAGARLRARAAGGAPSSSTAYGEVLGDRLPTATCARASAT